jgi:hypothetical protein
MVEGHFHHPHRTSPPAHLTPAPRQGLGRRSGTSRRDREKPRRFVFHKACAAVFEEVELAEEWIGAARDAGEDTAAGSIEFHTFIRAPREGETGTRDPGPGTDHPRLAGPWQWGPVAGSRGSGVDPARRAPLGQRAAMSPDGGRAMVVTSMVGSSCDTRCLGAVSGYGLAP